MALERLNGKGVLYADGGERRLAEINYQIMRTPPSEVDAESWHGTFTVARDIGEQADYAIELEDGRRGACDVSQGTRAMGGIPAVYHYGCRGSGPIT